MEIWIGKINVNFWVKVFSEDGEVWSKIIEERYFFLWFREEGWESLVEIIGGKMVKGWKIR